MPHLDLGAYLSDDMLSLDNVPSEKHPNGKTYRVASPSARFTLQLRRMMEVWGQRDADRSPTPEEIAELLELVVGVDGQPIDFQRRLLGDVHEEMVADGISGERLHQIGNLVMAYYGAGPHIAEAIIASPGKPAARANRAARRTAAKKTAGGKSAQASGGTANRTRKPASRGSSTSPTVREAAPKAM